MDSPEGIEKREVRKKDRVWSRTVTVNRWFFGTRKSGDPLSDSKGQRKGLS